MFQTVTYKYRMKKIISYGNLQLINNNSITVSKGQGINKLVS